MEKLGLSPSFWADRRVLLTGHTGFKGSWLALWLQELGAAVTGLALAPETSPPLFGLLEPWDGLSSNLVDLRDAVGVQKVVQEAAPQVVLHLAAQALVPIGYSRPQETFQTNVMGTVHLLEAIRTAAEAGRGPDQVVIVTTDKVYDHRGEEHPFREDDPLGGADPYSASKAACEHVVEAYRRSFLEEKGVQVRTVRAGNVIGGGDFTPGRLLPDVLRALGCGEAVQLRCPEATRPWQHVLEPLAGYLLLVETLAREPASVPPALNLGPRPESCVAVAEVVRRVSELWGSPEAFEVAPTSFEEAPRLELDASLAERSLGWRPRLSLQESLELTVSWTQEFERDGDLRSISRRQLADYARSQA